MSSRFAFAISDQDKGLAIDKEMRHWPIDSAFICLPLSPSLYVFQSMSVCEKALGEKWNLITIEKALASSNLMRYFTEPYLY